MAKRFIDTTIWTQNKWFRKLKPEMKLLWIYLFTNCDSVGVWEEDVELASFVIGYTYTIDSLSEFENKLRKINSKKYWIIDFCDFQYGVLKDNTKNKPHQSYINLLKKHSLWEDYKKTIQSLKDKEQEQEQEQEEEEDKVEEKETFSSGIEIFKYLNNLSEEKMQGMIEISQFSGDLTELKQKFSSEYIGRYALNPTKEVVLSKFQSWMNRDKNLKKPETVHEQAKKESAKSTIYPGKLGVRDGYEPDLLKEIAGGKIKKIE
jgi:hypothetical protein